VQPLASFSQTEELSLLRELAKVQNSDVRAAAVQALASFSRAEALPLLAELALEPDDNVAAEAIRGLVEIGLQSTSQIMHRRPGFPQFPGSRIF
jgi:HEAT repeat protein